MAEETPPDGVWKRTLESRLGQAEIRAMEAQQALKGHEDLCAERYKRLDEKLDDGKSRFRRLEWLLAIAVLAILGADPAGDQVARLLQAISQGGVQ
jgi:hypothetical protein